MPARSTRSGANHAALRPRHPRRQSGARRVLHGEQVPPDQKVYSIFETHTDLIERGKVLTPVEFGHKVFLAESGHGLITQYRVLDGNPADQVHVERSLKATRPLGPRRGCTVPTAASSTKRTCRPAAPPA